jgi:class 3 adenylate cyclase
MVAEGEPMDATTSLPTGTVTFLFTDIEGSTKLWEQYFDAMRDALARYDTLLRHAMEAHRGHSSRRSGTPSTPPLLLHAGKHDLEERDAQA